MNKQVLNETINKYVRENLSPKTEQREYISKKYVELQGFLSDNCFQTGSYARFTATDPVHDLDTIHPSKESTILDNPQIVVDSLYALLEDAYSKSPISKIKKISRQTHSVTIEFADCPESFSIDVVPAIELSELNEYGDPFYVVPEILRLNTYRRHIRYENEKENPIGWIKSDPRGYIKAASDMNDQNPNFRYSAKLGKKWRHECKMAYGDAYSFKSFHFELMFYRYFDENQGATTLDAIIDCIGQISQALHIPQFQDRADSNQYVDEYVRNLISTEKQLILKLQAEAYSILQKLPSAESVEELLSLLDNFIKVEKQNTRITPPAIVVNSPRQPWGY
ncbi:MAG: hypothetical protein RI947_224 [Candidatus Parcubacteria bacterium]|jgi:hypothetical protein